MQNPTPSPKPTDEGKKMRTRNQIEKYRDLYESDSGVVEICDMALAYLDAQQLQDSPPPLEKKDV